MKLILKSPSIESHPIPSQFFVSIIRVKSMQLTCVIGTNLMEID